MFKMYVTTTLRNLRRYKQYTLINLAALTLGLVPVIFILLYLQYELSFDRYHERADRIFRVVHDQHDLFGKKSQSPVLPSPLASLMVDKLPEVAAVTRLRGSRVREFKFTYGEKQFSEKNLVYADPSVFDIFSFELRKGNAKTALNEPQSIVVSEAIARKFFGDNDPMDKVLHLEGSPPLKVTGVLKNVSKQSHFLVDFLVPASLVSSSATYAGKFDAGSWGFSSWLIYILVREGADAVKIETKLPKLLETYSSNDVLNQSHFALQPLTDIHLHSHLSTEIGRNGDIKTVYLYGSIALIMLLIGCISYVNLATVRSSERVREIGVRKVCGARRSQLIAQFLGESIVLTLIAVVMAIVILELVLPYLNSFVERDLELSALFHGTSLVRLIVLFMLVSVCSGSYPALVLSGFSPVRVLKGRLGSTRPSHFRTTLVVAQCVFSIVFIVMALVVLKQMEYFRSQDVGYNIDRIVVVGIDKVLRDNLEAVKVELRQYPGILQVSSVSYLANQSFTARRIQIPGGGEDATIDMCYSNVDFDYLDLFEMKILEGRKFLRASASDVKGAYILNETAVKSLGWEGSAIGKEFSDRPGNKGKVIGIIKDFHLESLREEIKPMYLFIDPDGLYYNLCVRISPRNIPETIAFIKTTINRIVPDFMFNYRFYDEIFDSQYRAEQKLSRLFSFFAALGGLMACLGLVGLVSLTVAQRTKEIGIRKVLGASPLGITALFTLDYVRWVIVASVIGWPLAWYGAREWLQSFPYRVDLGWDVLLFSSILLIASILLAVGPQAIRAASANPVEALRYE